MKYVTVKNNDDLKVGVLKRAALMRSCLNLYFMFVKKNVMVYI